jgi:hypothetical protein
MSSAEEPVVAMGVPLVPQNAPFFLPQLYDDKVFLWADRPFVAATFSSMYAVPLPEDERVTRLKTKLKDSGMLDDEALVMTTIKEVDEPQTTFDVYMSVQDHAVSQFPPDRIRRLAGSFLCKVFEGQFVNSSWILEMQSLVRERTGETVDRKDLYACFPEKKQMIGDSTTKQYCILFAKCSNVVMS